jgi:peptidoglycan glycosyltransferase
VAARVALWLLPLLAGGWLERAGVEARERVWLTQGIERLAAGDVAAATARFDALAGSRRHATRAAAGLRLARALDGRSMPDAPRTRASGRAGASLLGVAEASEPLVPLDTLGVSLVGLLDGALRDGRLDACHELARLAYDARRPAGPLYLAAARIERGDDAGARALADAAPALFAGTALGQALTEALEWRERGALTIVRDRRGVLLGGLDAQARFTPRDAAAAACVPAAAQAALARAGTLAGVRLSVDLRLCALAYDALGAQRGSVVLIDAATGALRAAVSDARTRRREPQAAFTQWREPASVAKLMTTTAALRAGIDPDAFLRGRICLGSQRYGDGTLWCPARAVPLHGLAHALAISCNLAFADLAEALGRAALLDEYRRYGFALGDAEAPPAGLAAAESDDARAVEGGGGEADEPPAPIDGEAVLAASDLEARVLVADGGQRQLADLAIGLQDTAVTPLYGARLAAVFAYGALPSVVLIEARDGVLGRSPRALRRPAPSRVLDPAWLPRLWPAMQAAAEWGTAAGVAPPAFRVAMKTGTASQWRVGYHCNHVGVGPLPAPVVAFSVRVTHQPRSSAAGRAAREITTRLLGGLASLDRVGALP